MPGPGTGIAGLRPGEHVMISCDSYGSCAYFPTHFWPGGTEEQYQATLEAAAAAAVVATGPPAG